MESPYRKVLEAVHHVAKEGPKYIAGRKYLNWRDKTVRQRLRAAATEAGLTEPPQPVGLFELQQQKIKSLSYLRNWFKRIDRGHAFQSEPTKSPVSYWDGQHFFVASTDPTRPDAQTTFGELLADLVWDRKYNLDASVPKHLQKRYLLELIKQKIAHLTNLQLALYGYDKVPLSLEERLASPGNLAEDFIFSLFAKIQGDGAFPFQLSETDVQDDIARKMDFILAYIPESELGQESPRKHRLGIQFTMHADDAREAYKRQQVETVRQTLTDTDEIEDIAYVSFSLGRLNSTYNNWKKNPSPGGPALLLDRYTQKLIFREILRTVYSQEAIDRFWAKAKPTLRSASGNEKK